MNYTEWLRTVPSELTNDPIWKLEVYRLALFAGDIGWNDVLAFSKFPLVQHAKAAIGIISRITFYPLRLLSIVWS